MAAGRVGYEYDYDFCIDKSIIPLYKGRIPKKSMLFDTRTNFILKPRGGEDEIMDSERLGAYLAPDTLQYPELLRFQMNYRLAEYWMTNDEINTLVHAAFDFANRNAAANAVGGMIPVLINLRVRTVQQLGETLEAASDRALKARNLVPAYLWALESSATFIGQRKLRCFHACLPRFLTELPRIRVTDVNQGLDLMNECGICLRGPSIGAQVTVIQCSHAFHSHCIVNRLMDTCLCPVCDAPAYDPLMAEKISLSALTGKFPPSAC